MFTNRAIMRIFRYFCFFVAYLGSFLPKMTKFKKGKMLDFVV